MSKDDSGFGPRLRDLREKAGLTQVQLAERAGMHSQAVVKLERGERAPAWSSVQALAKALGVTCDSFMTAKSPTASAKPAHKSK